MPLVIIPHPLPFAFINQSTNQPTNPIKLSCMCMYLYATCVSACRAQKMPGPLELDFQWQGATRHGGWVLNLGYLEEHSKVL